MYLVRLISSVDHPNMAPGALLNLIQKTGTDRYDPSRKGMFADFYDKHHIDFFASSLSHKPTHEDLKRLQKEFEKKSAGDRQTAVSPDIAIIYDGDYCEMVEGVYDDTNDSDCFRFISTPAEALIEARYIDGLPKNRAQRLDQYVVQERPRLSRAFAVKLIEGGQVLVNGMQQKPGYKLRPNDAITIDFDEAALDVIPSIDLPVLYEDDNVIVINKPSGVISHARGKYWDEPSVASFIREKVTQSGNDGTSRAITPETRVNPAVGYDSRAGIVHRLDRATSGVMICAKNQETLTYLQHQFGERKVQKTYRAVISGQLQPEEAVIDMPIERNPKKPSSFRVGPNGKSAITLYTTEKTNQQYSLLRLSPKTGRTHQLRVHLRQLGHPIVGDTLYDGATARRLFLHAAELTLQIPGQGQRTFIAPLPSEFLELFHEDS